jgi:hypothetical protein
MNDTAMNDTNTTQVFAEQGRKGISYDWQSLLTDATSNDLASLRELDLELELATSF